MIEVLCHMLAEDGYDLSVDSDVDGMSVVALNKDLCVVVLNGCDVHVSFNVDAHPTDILNITAIVDSCCVDGTRISAVSQVHRSKSGKLSYNDEAIAARNEEIVVGYLTSDSNLPEELYDAYMAAYPEDQISSC